MASYDLPTHLLEFGFVNLHQLAIWVRNHLDVLDDHQLRLKDLTPRFREGLGLTASQATDLVNGLVDAGYLGSTTVTHRGRLLGSCLTLLPEELRNSLTRAIGPTSPDDQVYALKLN